jgi:hypothetical protein
MSRQMFSLMIFTALFWPAAGGLSLGRRQPRRAMAAPPATAMSAEIDRFLRASPHRYLPISGTVVQVQLK